MPGQNSKKLQNSKRPVVSKVVITILVIAVLAPVGLIGAGAAKCKIDQFNIKRSKQDSITTFENMKLMSDDVTPANVLLGGDCLDSDPFVQVDKRIQTTKPMSELLQDIRQTLTAQNYVLSEEEVTRHEGVGRANCGYSYGAAVAGNNIRFSVSISGRIDRDESPKCGATGNRIVDEAELTNQQANQVFSRLKI